MDQNAQISRANLAGNSLSPEALLALMCAAGDAFVQMQARFDKTSWLTAARK